MKNETIKVSQELTKARMKFQPSLIGKQILLLAIWKWGNSRELTITFNRTEFQKIYNMVFKDVKEIEKVLDTLSIVQYQIKTISATKERLEYLNLFKSIKYLDGLFVVSFNDEMIPILELEEKHFLLLHFKVLAKFRSKYSLILYEKIKTEWLKNSISLQRDELLYLFYVNDVSSYIKDWSLFRKKVLNVAIDELNKYTEYKVSYVENREGKKITSVTIYYTKKAIQEKKENINCHFGDRIHKTLSCSNCYKIANCNIAISNNLLLELEFEVARKLKKMSYNEQQIDFFYKLSSDEQENILSSAKNYTK